jgi:hypothetical protein
MTDSTPTDAPIKRTSRLRQPSPAEAGTQEPATAAPRSTSPEAVAVPPAESATVGVPEEIAAPTATPDPAPDMAQPTVAIPFVTPPPPPPPFVLREQAPARPGVAGPQSPPGDKNLELPGSPFHKHDVVQVVDPKHSFYGLFFVVGDVLRDKVHGYHMVEGHGRKEYITVDMSAVYYIGSSKVRSQNPCSPKWIADNRAS